MTDEASFDAGATVSRFMGAMDDDTDDTSYDERAARHDMRGPCEMVETVISECAAQRAEAREENPTVAQARVMSHHGEAIGAMVDAWATNGRRPYQYRYDGAIDVLRWNIPEAGTGWFVVDTPGHEADGGPPSGPSTRES